MHEYLVAEVLTGSKRTSWPPGGSPPRISHPVERPLCAHHGQTRALETCPEADDERDAKCKTSAELEARSDRPHPGWNRATSVDIVPATGIDYEQSLLPLPTPT